MGGYPFADPMRVKGKPVKECSHPAFQHCCIGQCRWMNNRHPNPHALLKKWSTPLATLLDVMQALHQAGKGCNLLWWGDSLSEDHLMAAGCELMREGYKISECNSNFGPTDNRVGEWNNPACNSSWPFPNIMLYYDGDHDRDDVVCKNITMVKVGDKKTPMQVVENLTSFVSEGGMAVASQGAHCLMNRTRCVQDWYQQVFLKATEDPTFENWTFAFREVEPSHFSNPGGQYDGPNKTCGKVDNIWNWRNEAAVQVLKKHYIDGDPPVIPLYGALSPLHYFHFDKSKDCQHYCYSPWRFQLTWEGMVRVLDSFRSNKNR